MMKIMSIPLLMLTVMALNGCNAVNELGQVGERPRLTQIRNPESSEDYRPVTMPMPHAMVEDRGENSLWKAGARSFFKDQRAHDIGDIMTILISFKNKADMKNETDMSRQTSEHIEAPNLMGYETHLNKIFPNAVSPANLVNFASTPTNTSQGAIKREETIDFKIAATVTQVLPNGNLVVMGRQEMRVNNEVREMLITGIVRPQDILAENTISYEKIAEARISYGGRGQISDIQQNPWGQQVLNIISPF